MRTTSNLASGSFRCWLHPRCVYACVHPHEKDMHTPAKKKTICLKMKKKPNCFPSGIWPAHSRFGGRRKKNQRKLRVVPTSATPYPHSSRRYLASCWQQLRERYGFSAAGSDGLKTAAARSCFTSVSTGTCLRRAKRSRVGGGNRGQDPFFSPLSFFFLLLFNPLHGSQSP